LALEKALKVLYKNYHDNSKLLRKKLNLQTLLIKILLIIKLKYDILLGACMPNSSQCFTATVTFKILITFASSITHFVVDVESTEITSFRCSTITMRQRPLLTSEKTTLTSELYFPIFI